MPTKKSPWITQNNYRGMITLRRSLGLPVGFCADSLNGDLGSSTVAAPLKGYAAFGHQTNKNQPIIRKHTYYRGDGTAVLLHIRDDGTNYILEYLNTEDVRNSDQGEWSILESGLGRSINLKDGTTKKATFGFSAFNDTGSDQLIYGNGVNGMRIWNGAVASVASSTINSITIAGSLTCAQRGFVAAGAFAKVIVNGTIYTYTGLSGNTLTGVTTDPTGEPVGSGLAQSPESTSYGSADKGCIFITNLARLFLAGMTATPNQVTYSKVGDATSFSGSNPDDGGLEDFPDMNGDITALSYIDNWIVVFSLNRIIAFKFDYPTSTTRTIIRKVIADEGCSNQKAVQKIGDKIYYITPHGGLKYISQIAALDVFNITDLTDGIRPSIENFDWSDASLGYNTGKRILMAAGRSSNGVNANDRAISLFFTLDEFNQPTINLGIMDWFIGDMCDYNGDLHFGSSIDCKDLKAFDGYSKDGAPYDWRRTERVEFFNNVWDKKRMPFLALRGAIGNGTTLYLTLKYNTNGVLTSSTMELRADDTRFVTQSALNTLGGFALGTEPLGGTIEEIGEMFPFKVIFPLPEIDFEDVQLTMSTSGVGQQIVIDTHAFYVTTADETVTATELKELGVTPDPIPSLP